MVKINPKILSNCANKIESVFSFAGVFFLNK